MKYCKLLLMVLLCTQYSFSTTAQSWQWGKVRKDVPKNNTNNMWGSCIATDPNGNLYTLSIDSNIHVPGHFRAGYSKSNLCIISYDCQGNFRWSKMIEGGGEFANEIKTDKVGGVYVNAIVMASMKSLKLDEDAIIPQTKKHFVVVKFDTSGNYKWHYMPEPDSLNPKGYDYTKLAMEVSANGDIRELVSLRPNAFCDSNYIVTDSPFSVHIISHTADGKFDKGIRLGISGGTINGIKMAWDEVNDKFYINCPSSLDSVKSTDGMVLSKFDNLGNNEWVKKGSKPAISSASGIYWFTKVITDEEGAVYMSCQTTAGETFDGYTFNNEAGIGVTSAILKYDKNGNRLWVANTKVGGDDVFTFAKSKNSIGAYAPLSNKFVRWQAGYDVGKSFASSAGGGFTDSLNLGSYFVRFDAATGAVIGVDSILGANLSSGNIVGNGKEGYYILGMTGVLNQVLTIPNKDTMRGVNYGMPLSSSISSPFLLKYGSNDCGLTSISSTASGISELRIYPNPSSDFIIIENATKSSKINIYNTLGQLVFQKKLSENSEKLNIKQLTAGMYIVELISENNERQRVKLLKE